MSLARRLHYTVAEYVQLEAESLTRHEYLDGEIYAMAGGTPEHAALAAAIIAILQPGVHPLGCWVATSDLRVHVVATGLTTYPDASVICGSAVRAKKDRNAVTNPVLLVEVTSDSTEEYDRGAKLAHYQQIPSVRAVLFVSHRTRHLTLHRREGTTWHIEEAHSGEWLHVHGARQALRVDVNALYDGIDLTGGL